MSEAELVELIIDATNSVLQVVALYFTIVSAYIAALYYFLNKAPILMKFIGFAFMSGALAFLGITSIAIERTTTGLVDALDALPHRVTLAPPASYYYGLDTIVEGHVNYGVMAGWAMAFSIYVGLFYLTFLHRWRT